MQKFIFTFLFCLLSSAMYKRSGIVFGMTMKRRTCCYMMIICILDYPERHLFSSFCIERISMFKGFINSLWHYYYYFDGKGNLHWNFIEHLFVYFLVSDSLTEGSRTRWHIIIIRIIKDLSLFKEQNKMEKKKEKNLNLLSGNRKNKVRHTLSHSFVYSNVLEFYFSSLSLFIPIHNIRRADTTKNGLRPKFRIELG